MPAMQALNKGTAEGVLVAPLGFTKENGPFTRAVLWFSDVNHSGLSYEVRVFLNNPQATAQTPRDPAQGYAGRYVVFGHGGCYGDVGHCDVPPPTTDPTDLRLPHQLTPQTKSVIVTDALHKVLAENPNGLESVTLVAVSKAPRRRDRNAPPADSDFGAVHLYTYLNDTEADVAEG